MATQNAIGTGYPIPVTDGGTGSTSASGARTALGLAIGTDVQAYDAELAALAGLTSAADQVPYFTGSGTAALMTVTSAARTVLDDTSTANMLTTLGAAASGANTDITSVYLNNTGLKIKDTNASHGLIIAPGSDITADRTLTVTTGDASRTLTLSGDATLSGGTHSGTNTGDQNIFQTISVSGQSDVVADTTTDTLTLAAGSGISITTNAGTDTITITNTGASVAYSEVTGTTQAMAVNTRYAANNASVVAFTLPSTAAIGDVVYVLGKGAGGWSIAQNSGQTIHFSDLNTTTGVGGSLASTNRYDCIEIICITANTDWIVPSVVGNITIV